MISFHYLIMVIGLTISSLKKMEKVEKSYAAHCGKNPTGILPQSEA